MTEQPIIPDPLPAPEPPVGANVAAGGTNNLQRSIDTMDRTFGGFVKQLGALITDTFADARRTTSMGSATTSSGVRATNPSSAATGGGYASRAPSGQPMATMGGVFANLGYRLGSGGMPPPGGGGGGGGAGISAWGLAAGMAVTGAFKMLGGYAQRTTPTVLTMDKAAYQGILNSGIGPGGYSGTAQRAVSAIYGTNNRNLNVTAQSPADAQSAAAILNYYSGATMMNTDGSANKAWFTAQSGMYKLGYANPYMTQTQVATSLASIYSPRSNMAALQLGYQTPFGAGGTRADPLALAQNIFSRTFRGQSSVSPGTLAAALGPGGSLNANLTYLGQQAGWAPGTTSMLSSYLQQYNTAINKGATPALLSSLMDKASRGDKGAQSQLSQYGMGNTTIQDIKTLQATQTGRTADQYGDFNSSLQDSIGLLNSFNRALSDFLNDTGLGSGLATAGGFASAFPGLTGGLGSFLGGYTTGRFGGSAGGGAGGGGGGGGGGAGGVLGGIAGTGVNVATSLGSLALGGAAWRNGGGILKGALGRLGGAGGGLANLAGSGGGLWQSAGDLFADRFGMMGLSEGAAGLGALGVAGAGLGVGYAGGKLAQQVSKAGPGASTGRELSRLGINTASDAAAGALIGSVVPGVGTLIGGVAGGTFGLGQSLWDWWKDKRNANSSLNNVAANTTSSRIIASGLNPAFSKYGLGSGASTTTPVGGAPSGVTPAVGATNAGTGAAQKAVAFAVAQANANKPYQWGATGPDAYDCSGLTQAAYASAGVKIPRTSQAQMTIGSPVKQGSEVPGDLMLPEPGHVTMCIGGGKLVEAPHSGANVRIRAYDPKEFPTIRRVVASANTGQNTAASGGNGASAASALLTPHLVGPNGSISELDALNGALAEKYSPPTQTQNQVAAGQSMVSGITGTGLDPQNLGGTVKDIYGHTYKVPSGPKPPGTPASWISTALGLAGKPQSFASDLSIIVQGESGGNPWAINLTDSNAKADTPSEGIAQTIQPTFAHYAMPGHTNIWNPVDNLIAAIGYADARYGSLDKVPGVVAVKSGRPYVGYKVGAWSVPQDQTAMLHKGEMVVPAEPAGTIRDALLKDSLYSPSAAAGAKNTSAGVNLNFAAGSIQVSIPNASAQSAAQAAKQIVSNIMTDPRVAKMAVGL